MRRAAFFMAAIAVLAAWSQVVPFSAASGAETGIAGNNDVRGEWLDEPVTVEEAERKNPGMPDDDRAARFPEIRKPFGFQSGKWEAIKAQMQPGDQLWTFSSSMESWKHLAGRSGIVLVRNKTVIASIVTMMN